jgi:hypothetical protein
MAGGTAGRPPRRRLIAGIVLMGLAAAVVLTLVLGPPAKGVANNGDYERLTTQLGVTAAPGHTLNDAAALTLRYRTGVPRDQLGLPPELVRSPLRFNYYYGYSSSELPIARTAIDAQRVAQGHGLFDLRWLGAFNALVLLTGLAFVLSGARQTGTRGWVVASILAVLAFTDLGYVLYLNSFYSEPAELGFLLATVGAAATVGLVRRSFLCFACFSAAGALLVTTKTEDAIYALPLALLGLALAHRQLVVVWQRRGGYVLSALVLAAGAWSYTHAPPYLTQVHLYNSVFDGILVVAPDKKAALAELGLSRSLATYAGQPAFSSQNSFFASPNARADFFDRMSTGKILAYYLRHPQQAWSAAERAARSAPELRVTGLSNLTTSKSAATGQFATDSPWTVVHRDAIPHSAWFVLPVFLVAAAVGGRWVVGVWRSRAERRSSPEVLLAVCVMGLIAFATPVIGDGFNEVVKHEFSFNVLFDLTAITLVALAVDRGVRAVRGDGPVPLRSLRFIAPGRGRN